MLNEVMRWTGAFGVVLAVYCVTPNALPETRAAEAAIRPSADSSSGQDPIFMSKQSSPETDSALKEFGSARSDHAAIALKVSQCYKDLVDPMTWSPSVRALLLFGPDENLAHAANVEPATNGHIPPLSPFHSAAVLFSDHVSRNRLALQEDLDGNRSRAKFYQFLIVGLGALATIFIGMRAVAQGDTKTSQVVGICAIAFSAFGAAAASMNSFEGSMAIALRDQRALSQLQQLHWRIASDVMRKPELCGTAGPPSAEATKDSINVIAAWHSRLEAILDDVVDSISKPGDLSNGATPEKLPALDQRNPQTSAKSSQPAG